MGREREFRYDSVDGTIIETKDGVVGDKITTLPYEEGYDYTYTLGDTAFTTNTKLKGDCVVVVTRSKKQYNVSINGETTVYEYGDVLPGGHYYDGDYNVYDGSYTVQSELTLNTYDTVTIDDILYSEIDDLEDLKIYCGIVNKGVALNGYLKSDIDCQKENISLSSNGIFDGNGHSLSNIQGGTALVNDARDLTIKNLIVANSTFENSVFLNNITDSGSDYSTNIYNCGSVNNTLTGSDVGEYFMRPSYPNGFTLNIKNCYAFNDSNSYPMFEGYYDEQNYGGVIEKNYFYTPSKQDSENGFTYKTNEEFASGEVTYLLNEEETKNTIWKQTLGENAYPNFSGKTVAYITHTQCDGTTSIQEYSNTLSDIFESHVDENNDSVCDKWGKQVAYIVTFDTNEHGTAPEKLENIKPGEKITTPDAPSEEGYIFGGWYKDENCSEEKVWDFENDTVNVNTTLYAKWTPDTYTITYNPDGGSLTTENPTTYTIESSHFTLNNPTKEGYTFAGWVGTDIDDEAATTVTIKQGSTGNRTYTATWVDTILEEAIAKINSIGEVVYTNECKAKIDEARHAYDTLTVDQKEKITAEQYKVLTDAEEKYISLKPANSGDPTNTTPTTPSNPTNTTPSTPNDPSKASEPKSETSVTTDQNGNKVETTKTVDKSTGTTTVEEKKTTPDGTVIETRTEIKKDGSTTETSIEAKKDGTVTETKKKVASDGSSTETSKETMTNGSTTETTTRIDTNGTAKSTIVSSDATTGDKFTVTKTETKQGEVTKATASLVTNDTTIKKADMNRVETLANKKVKADANANIICDFDKLVSTQRYELVSKKQATTIEKKILETVKVKSSIKTIKKNSSTQFEIDKELDMDNVESIKYSSKDKSVATVSKSGLIVAKDAGKVTVKAKISLLNGKTKTVKMTIIVK